MTLVEFLTARLNEDELVAKIPSGRWYMCDDGCIVECLEQWADGDDRLPNHHNSWYLIHDPARVLAEVEAKRRIIEATGIHLYREDETLHHWVLCQLALAYADHSDYDESWRM